MTSTPSEDRRYAALLAERLLLATSQRDELTASIDAMRTARSLTFADDEHDPEGSTVSLDQARDAALLARAQHSISELLAAQERLAAGSYGRCEQCGEVIPAERLSARPEARLCVPCSAKAAR